MASRVKPTGVEIIVLGASGMRKKSEAKIPERRIQKGKRFFFFFEKIFLPCLSFFGMERIIVENGCIIKSQCELTRVSKFHERFYVLGFYSR